VLLEDRHELLVRSVAVLLAPKANLASINGVYERAFPGQPPHLVFRYQVIRVWELSPEQLLQGGLATLPLAPVSAVAERELPGVIGQMKARLADTSRPQAGKLWTAANLLMGLRYEPALVEKLLEGISEMEESKTYQAIVEKGREKGRQEGRIEEVRKMLLEMGSEQLGKPSAGVVAAIKAVDDLKSLEGLLRRHAKVSTWEDLLPPQPASSRRKPAR
jgi:hypothetical protein